MLFKICFKATIEAVIDKAHRVQLSEDMLEAAGIDSNKVKITARLK